jgi:hypothetical protein
MRLRTVLVMKHMMAPRVKVSNVVRQAVIISLNRTQKIKPMLELAQVNNNDPCFKTRKITHTCTLESLEKNLVQ